MPLNEDVIQDIVKRIAQLEQDVKSLRSQKIYPISDYTVSLLHFNTDFTDQRGSIWTVAGGAQISSAQYKFGGAALALDGAGDDISTPDSSSHQLGTGDWAIELWGRFASVGINQTLVGRTSGSAPYAGFYCGINSSNKVRFVTDNNTDRIVSSGSVTTGQWYHFAWAKSGTTITQYINGNVDGTWVGNAQAHAYTLHVGSLDGTQQYINGWLDEFRISKGIARFTSAFTPPTSEYI